MDFQLVPIDLEWFWTP